ncbi:MAG TPA: hypothetical protein DCR55_10835 [Lentisphaeria bacterium]|jgi:phosphatidylserine/phosphatidylglycerophosphate/cardiolipin synthase-like enzyme|nr:hypothetical protein [Lentisphaeria bacterium]
MKPAVPLLALCLLLCSAALSAREKALVAPGPAKVQVAFQGDCETLVLESIEGAQRELLLAVFSFTRTNIAKALVEAQERGVDVQLKLDEFQAKSKYSQSALAVLKKAKIPIEHIAMPPYSSMHHKFMVVDRREVLTGSYNFTTKATTDNYENLVRISSGEVARAYYNQWQAIKGKKK